MKILETIDYPGSTFKLALVYCGKPTCTRCPHGPYWYRFLHTRIGTKRIYCGKATPIEVALARKSAERLDQPQASTF